MYHIPHVPHTTLYVSHTNQLSHFTPRLDPATNGVSLMVVLLAVLLVVQLLTVLATAMLWTSPYPV